MHTHLRAHAHTRTQLPSTARGGDAGRFLIFASSEYVQTNVRDGHTVVCPRAQTAAVPLVSSSPPIVVASVIRLKMANLDCLCRRIGVVLVVIGTVVVGSAPYAPKPWGTGGETSVSRSLKNAAFTVFVLWIHSERLLFDHRFCCRPVHPTLCLVRPPSPRHGPHIMWQQ